MQKTFNIYYCIPLLGWLLWDYQLATPTRVALKNSTQLLPYIPFVPDCGLFGLGLAFLTFLITCL